MKKTIRQRMKSAPKKTVRKPFRKNDANKLSVCSIKGTCPIADVYNCRVHLWWMTHSPCQRLVSTRVSTSGAPTTSDPIQSGGGNQPYYYDQLIAPTSGVTGLYKSWKVSGSKIELEFCAAGSNTVPVYVWLLPVSSDNASLPTNPPTSTVSSLKAHHPHSRRWISDSAEDNKLSSYHRPRQHHLERLECQRLRVSRSLQLWTSS